MTKRGPVRFRKLDAIDVLVYVLWGALVVALTGVIWSVR